MPDFAANAVSRENGWQKVSFDWVVRRPWWAFWRFSGRVVLRVWVKGDVYLTGGELIVERATQGGDE